MSYNLSGSNGGKIFNISRIFFNESEIDDGITPESKKQYVKLMHDRLQYYKNNYVVVQDMISKSDIIKNKLSELRNMRELSTDGNLNTSLDLAISGFQKILGNSIGEIAIIKDNLIEIYNEDIDFKLLGEILIDYRIDIRGIVDINQFYQTFSTNISTMCVLQRILNFRITLMWKYEGGESVVYLIFDKGKLVHKYTVELKEILEDSRYAHDRYRDLIGG